MTPIEKAILYAIGTGNYYASNIFEEANKQLKKEDEIETDLTGSHKGFTDLIAEMEGDVLRIEIEHRSTKEQIKKSIRKTTQMWSMR